MSLHAAAFVLMLLKRPVLAMNLNPWACHVSEGGAIHNGKIKRIYYSSSNPLFGANWLRTAVAKN